MYGYYISIGFLIGLIVILSLILRDLDKRENYIVDITGGCKNLSCGCEGDCILNYKDYPL